MEEILIGEKKYVSSKQAAKLTGYAKDYIGQLCREGRVPARLVGRSWYVLESAIHDHRFGKLETEGTGEAHERPQKTFISSAWDSPRYEAVPREEISPVRHSGAETTEKEPPPDEELNERLEDSWKAWFDRVVEATPSPARSHKENESDTGTTNGREVNIPFRAVQRALPDELIPHRRSMLEEKGGIQQESRIEGTEKQSNPIKRSTFGHAALTAGVLLAALAVSVAAVNSGSFDKYDLISQGQAGVISGITIYEK